MFVLSAYSASLLIISWLINTLSFYWVSSSVGVAFLTGIHAPWVWKWQYGVVRLLLLSGYETGASYFMLNFTTMDFSKLPS